MKKLFTVLTLFIIGILGLQNTNASEITIELTDLTFNQTLTQEQSDIFNQMFNSTSDLTVTIGLETYILSERYTGAEGSNILGFSWDNPDPENISTLEVQSHNGEYITIFLNGSPMNEPFNLSMQVIQAEELSPGTTLTLENLHSFDDLTPEQEIVFNQMFNSDQDVILQYADQTIVLSYRDYSTEGFKGFIEDINDPQSHAVSFGNDNLLLIYNAYNEDTGTANPPLQDTFSLTLTVPLYAGADLSIGINDELTTEQYDTFLQLFNSKDEIIFQTFTTENTGPQLTMPFRNTDPESENFGFVVEDPFFTEISFGVFYDVITNKLTFNGIENAPNDTLIILTKSQEDTTPPEIILNGEEIIYIEVGDTYTDPGAIVKDNYDEDKAAEIIDGDFSTNEVGTYTIIYRATDAAGNQNTIQVNRTVIVEDTTPPEIILNGDATITIEGGGTYTDPGAIFTDNANIADNTATVESNNVNTAVPGTYQVVYIAVDAAGNESATVTRTVIVEDTTPPEIILNGDATITIEGGDTYTDAGAIFTDNVDEDGYATVQSNNVNTAVPGTYQVVYIVVDAAGNESATVTRTVIVEDTTPPVINTTPAAITLQVGDTYTDPGVMFTDNVDEDGYATVQSNNVNTAVPGTYQVVYIAVDAAGNESATVTRTVIVEDTATGGGFIESPDGTLLLLGLEWYYWLAIAGLGTILIIKTKK